MEYAYLLAALALTWLPGCVWLSRLVPRGSPGRSCQVSGYGLLLGLMLVPLVMRGLSAVDIPFSLINIGLPMTMLLAMGLLLPLNWRLDRPDQSFLPPQSSNNRWQTLVICICVSLIFARLVSLGLEVWLRPIFSWDGKQHWAKQAKIFFELRSIVPYVPFREWLELGGSDVYTTVHANYPVTVPLLQTWTSTALGQWHESLINLPWVLCYLAMGLIFFGQSRAAGASSVIACATTYMLLSMPYLNIQVALAGYADIFMSACYLAAVAAFFNWSNSRAWGQAILCIIFALCGLLIKNEGVFWLLSFIPGLIFALLGPKRGIALITGLSLLLLLALWLLPGDLVIAGQTLNGLDLQYRPQSWPAIYQSLLVQDNWHLLGFLFIALSIVAAARAISSLPRIIPAAAVVLSALCLFLVLYLLTTYAAGAVSFTSINRVALQLMPAVAFLATLLYLEITRRRPV